VLREICGSKREQLTKEWRKLHNEELHDLCSSPSIVRVRTVRYMGTCSAYVGEERRTQDLACM
jgi:hypothetical protein